MACLEQTNVLGKLSLKSIEYCVLAFLYGGVLNALNAKYGSTYFDFTY